MIRYADKKDMTTPPEKKPFCAPVAPLRGLARAVCRWWQESVFGFPAWSDRPTDNGPPAPLPSSPDKRRHLRIALSATTVRVTDGCMFATARMENISPDGLCLGNLPEQLFRSPGRLTVFSSDNPGLPVLHVEPRWQRTGRGGKTMGATILNATESWRVFFVHTASRMQG